MYRNFDILSDVRCIFYQINLYLIGKYDVTKVVFNTFNLEPMTGVQDYQMELIEVTVHLDRPNQLEV